jgi:serine/threonine protein kinase/Tol biopolymer transport system component
MPLEPGTLISSYEIVALIGGNMGDVYRARDSRLPRDVAIKVLPASVADNPTRRARFDREALAISRLSHPHICEIYDVGTHDGAPFFVMQFIEGESLDARLRAGPLSWTVALQSAIQIASALEAAHRAGIVHRDLKPGNVMINDAGITLIDFGIAKLLEPDGSATQPDTLTADRIVGTVNYMAPEQLEGRPVDGRTDLFALGAVLYEVLSGRKAFDGPSTASVTAAILTSEPPPVSTFVGVDNAIVPPALDHLVRRALAKDPDDRWQTARDLRHELEWILSGPQPVGVVAPPAPATFSRRRLLTIAGATGLGFLAGWFGHRRPAVRTEPPRRFTIEAPPGSELDAKSYAMVAVSPDGAEVAFLAWTNGVRSIWVRPLMRLNARRLLGTEGAFRPVWSPASQSIAFQSDRNVIQQVDSSGGPPRPVVAVAKGRGIEGLCWLSDDTIVFAQNGHLYRVPASGGDAKEVATPDQSRGESLFSLPTSLNGRLLYLVSKGGSQPFAYSQIAGRTTPPVTLEIVQSNAVLAGGYLIFRQGTALVAQLFDERTQHLIGQPVRLVDDVDFTEADARTVFSASDDILVYRPATARQLTWFDRQGTPLKSVGEAGHDFNPAISYDGSRIAIDRNDPAHPRFQIWTLDEQGHAAQITRGVADRYPMWSRDGQWITYLSGSAAGAEVRRTRVADGTDEKLLEPGVGRPLDWSANGELIISDSDGKLMAWSHEDKTARPLTKPEVRVSQARLSPDGEWLAYARTNQDAQGVWVQPFPSDGTPQHVSADDAYYPSWSEDGRELYYMTPTGDVKALSVTTGPQLRFGSPVTLFSRGATALDPPRRAFAAAPDGQRFLVNEMVQNEKKLIVIEHWQSLVR